MYIQRRRDPDAQGFGSMTGLLEQGGIEVTTFLLIRNTYLMNKTRFQVLFSTNRRSMGAVEGTGSGTPSQI